MLFACPVVDDAIFQLRPILFFLSPPSIPHIISSFCAATRDPKLTSIPHTQVIFHAARNKDTYFIINGGHREESQKRPSIFRDMLIKLSQFVKDTPKRESWACDYCYQNTSYFKHPLYFADNYYICLNNFFQSRYSADK